MTDSKLLVLNTGLAPGLRGFELSLEPHMGAEPSTLPLSCEICPQEDVLYLHAHIARGSGCSWDVCAVDMIGLNV